MDIGDDEDILGPSDEEDQHAITLTPKEVLQRLETAWVNEKISPVLLPPLQDEKNAMTQQIKVMKNNVSMLNRNDWRTEIHKLEVERIKFIVISYVRIRFFKIQECAWHYHDQEIRRARYLPSLLMPEEFAFLQAFVKRTEEYWRNTLLSKMPLPLQKFDLKKFKKKPQMDSYVFLRVNENVDVSVEVEDAHGEKHWVALKEGEQHIMRFAPVSPLVAKEEVHLV